MVSIATSNMAEAMEAVDEAALEGVVEASAAHEVDEMNVALTRSELVASFRSTAANRPMPDRARDRA